MNKKNIRIFCLGLLAMFLVLASTAWADTTEWKGSSSTDWFDGDNWSLGVPESFFDVYIPSGTTYEPSISSGDAAANSLVLDGNTFNQSGGQLQIEWHYDLYSGTVDHSGGTATARYMSLSDSIYYLSNAAELNLVDLYIHQGSTFDQGGTLGVENYRVLGGTVQQSGGVVNVNFLSVGQGDPLTPGIYELTGGSLNANQVIIGMGSSDNWYGDAGIGTLQVGGDGNNPTLTANTMIVGNVAASDPIWIWNGTNWYQCHGLVTQYDGDVTVYDNLVLGQNGNTNGFGPAIGVYELNDGTLSVGWNEYIGRNGSGTFIQNGGTHSVGWDLVLGWGASGSGTYVLNDGSLEVYGNERIGRDGSGTFTQTGGTNTVSGDINLGRWATGTGTYDLQGGDLTVEGTLFVGDAATGTSGEWGLIQHGGTFNQNGGTLTVNGEMILGNQPGSTGIFTQSHPDSETTVNGSLIVGNAGLGKFVQTGGSLYVGGDLIVGQAANNLWNSLTLGDPNNPGATSTTTVAGDMIVGQSGTVNPTAFAEAKIYQGNTLTVESNLIVGQNPDSWGHFYNQGGTLTVSSNLVIGENSWGQELEPGKFNPNVFAQPHYLYWDGTVYDTYADTATTTVYGNMTVGDAGFGRVVHKLGTIDVGGSLTLGNQGGSRGDYFLNTVITSDPPLGYPGLPPLYTGSLSVGTDMVVGNVGYGRVVQMLGTATVGGSLTLGSQTGSTGIYLFNTATGYEFTVGTHPDLFTGTLTVGDTLKVGGAGTGQFIQGGGTLNVAKLEVGNSTGSGTFTIENAASVINVSQSLTFGANATFTAVPGATIHMTGSNFNNLGTNPLNQTGLSNLTMIFEGGEVWDRFEVAGTKNAGFDNNFALDTLKIGGTQEGWLKLFDDVDNNGSGGTDDEVLYVASLILGLGSKLDLSDIDLYCLSFTNLGGEILGGKPHVVPLPSTLLLLASGLGGLALMGRKRFSRLGK